MLVYLGADHRGHALKEKLQVFLEAQGHDVRDLSPDPLPGDDYPQIAYKLAEKVLSDPEARGILACGSGAGVTIAANRFPRIRAVLGATAQEVAAARNDDDVNVLTLAADFISEEDALEMAGVFLSTLFEAVERRLRRIAELDNPPSFS